MNRPNAAGERSAAAVSSSSSATLPPFSPPPQLDSGSFHTLDRRSVDGTVSTNFALPFGYEPPTFPAGTKPECSHSLGLDGPPGLLGCGLQYGHADGGSSGCLQPQTIPLQKLLLAGGINDDNGKTIAMLDDILIEILSWLPASSLSRFRLVCKHWYALITNDLILAKLQFERGFISSGPSVLVCSSHCRLTLMDHKGGHKHLVYSTEGPFGGISPSCNGLVCIYKKLNDPMLLNPTTREELMLPKPVEDDVFSEFYIGYEPLTKQYKVVRFYDLPTRCEVLTIGTSSWRQITINTGFCADTAAARTINGGVSINGIMYWITGLWVLHVNEILSFDLDKEIFNIVQFPGVLNAGGDELLSEVEGQLFIARVRVDVVEIWILEDITSQTWVRRYTLGFPEMFGRLFLIHQGKLLVSSDEGLHYRDLETGLINIGSIYDDEQWNTRSGRLRMGVFSQMTKEFQACKEISSFHLINETLSNAWELGSISRPLSCLEVGSMVILASE